MKGAFEYACKIWEELLPNTLPINIHAKIGKIRGSGNGKLLSRVQPTSYNLDNLNDNLSSRIKYVILAEYNTGSIVTFSDSIKHEYFFTSQISQSHTTKIILMNFLLRILQRINMILLLLS